MFEKIFDLMIKQLNIHSILDVKIKWERILSWLSCYSWIGKSQGAVIAYCRKRGLPELWT